MQALCLAVKVLVVRVRVDATENRVSGFYPPAVRTRLRADVDHVAGPHAFLKARGVACDYRERRLVYAARLAVLEADLFLQVFLFRGESIQLVVRPRL